MYVKRYIDEVPDFNHLVLLGETTESIFIDFKLELVLSNLSKGSRKEKAKELASDICQFSNSFGGVLIIGIKEEEDIELGRKVAIDAPGVDNFEDISRFVNDSVLPLLHPKNLNINLVSLKLETSKQIVVINVRPLVEGVACVCSPTLPYKAIYPYRTHYGKSYLHPSEVEKRMSETYRIIPLKLEEISRTTRSVTIYPALDREPLDKYSRIESKEDNIILVEVLRYEYQLNINGVCINIPFSLTEDAWLTEKKTIGILLKTRLTVNSSRKEIGFSL